MNKLPLQAEIEAILWQYDIDNEVLAIELAIFTLEQEKATIKAL